MSFYDRKFGNFTEIFPLKIITRYMKKCELTYVYQWVLRVISVGFNVEFESRPLRHFFYLQRPKAQEVGSISKIEDCRNPNRNE